jgi:hypothetical protein
MITTYEIVRDDGGTEAEVVLTRRRREGLEGGRRVFLGFLELFDLLSRALIFL